MSLSLFERFKIGIGLPSSYTVGPMVAAKSFVGLLELNNQLLHVDRVRVDLFRSQMPHVYRYAAMANIFYHLIRSSAPCCRPAVICKPISKRPRSGLAVNVVAC